MNGFWGSFEGTLDGKGRINFPVKFRKNLKEEDENFLMLVRGNEMCISVYPRTAWQEKVNLIRSKVATDQEFGIVSRRLMYQASEQKIDKQGRLNLTANLIQYAQLDEEIFIVGFQSKIEIWNQAKYSEIVEKTEATYRKIAGELDI